MARDAPCGTDRHLDPAPSQIIGRQAAPVERKTMP